MLNLTLCRHKCFSARQKEIGYLYGLIQQAASIIPQVNHQRSHPPLLQVQKSLLELLGRIPREGAEIDITYIIIQHRIIRYERQLDGTAHNVEIQRFLCTGTLHFQLEAGTHLSAKHLADFLVVLSGKVFSVNFHQNISGFQAYIGSRHILVWLRYHGTFQFRIPSNHRTYTTIGILQHLLQFALVIFRIILRVGIQRVEHGINAFTDSLVRINRIHVKHIQLFHNGIEYIQILCYLETAAITTLKPPKTNGSCYNQQGNHPAYL